MDLVEDTFDFKVLVGERIEIGKKKALKLFVIENFKRFTYDGEKIQNATYPVIKASFFWINNFPNWLEKMQYRFLNKCFDNKMEELKMSGFQPDLIHIQSLSDTSVFICNWAEKYHIPVILTEHLIYIRRKFDFFQKEKERVYSRVKKVLCVSNYVYRNLLTNGFKMQETRIIGNLVDDKFLPSSFPKTTGKNKVLFVASHLHDKDIQVFLQAIKLLVTSDYKEFKVDIIGLDPELIYTTDSDRDLSLEQYIEKLELRNFVQLKGQMKKADLLQTYKDYSFLVSTSLSETFGLAIAEAIINGLPVVCTDSGGIRDYVDAKNGIIVPVRDPKALSEGIIRMFKELDQYNTTQMSYEIIKRYGRIAFAKKIINEYSQQIRVNG